MSCHFPYCMQLYGGCGTGCTEALAHRGRRKAMGARLSKPIKTDPKLVRLLEENAKQVAKMSPDELEAMLKAQAKSWARQDLD